MMEFSWLSRLLSLSKGTHIATRMVNGKWSLIGKIKVLQRTCSSYSCFTTTVLD